MVCPRLLASRVQDADKAITSGDMRQKTTASDRDYQSLAKSCLCLSDCSQCKTLSASSTAINTTSGPTRMIMLEVDNICTDVVEADLAQRAATAWQSASMTDVARFKIMRQFCDTDNAWRPFVPTNSSSHVGVSPKWM